MLMRLQGINKEIFHLFLDFDDFFPFLKMLEALSIKINHQKECIQQEKLKLQDLMEKYKIQSYQFYHPIIQKFD